MCYLYTQWSMVIGQPPKWSETFPSRILVRSHNLCWVTPQHLSLVASCLHCNFFWGVGQEKGSWHVGRRWKRSLPCSSLSTMCASAVTKAVSSSLFTVSRSIMGFHMAFWAVPSWTQSPAAGVSQIQTRPLKPARSMDINTDEGCSHGQLHGREGKFSLTEWCGKQNKTCVSPCG